MITALAKVQEELKSLIVKEKTKKPKKLAGVVNLGRTVKASCRASIFFKGRRQSRRGNKRGRPWSKGI